MAPFDEVEHLAIEEGKEQRANVGAVDVGVGHDDDFVVAAFGEVDFFADADADGLNHAADFLVGEDFIFARFVGVDDFAAEGKDGLVFAEAATLALPPAESPSTKYSSQRSMSRLVQSRSLPGKPPPASAPLRSRRSALALRAASRASAARMPLLTMTLATLGFSSRYLPRPSPTTELTMPSISPLPSLVLVWPSNCGWGRASR